MRVLLRIAATAALIACIIWAANKPGFDSICAALGAIAVLIGTFQAERKSARSMTQTLGDNSTGIQAGNDVNFNK